MTNRPIRGVAFDLDGLMFNTEDIFELAGDELMRRRERVMTHEVRSRMIGRRAEEALAILIEAMSLTGDTVPGLKQELQEIFRGYIEEHLKPMPGLFDLLDLLEKQGIPKGVATSSPRDYLETILATHELQSRYDFQFTLTAEDVTEGKPHPEIYQRAAELLTIPPSEMLVLEDSSAGTTAGGRAGAVVVSIPSRHTRDGDFGSATHIVDHLGDPIIRDLLS